MTVMYAAAISDALSNRDISIDELKVLKHHAEAILESQGDLVGAVEKLSRQIARLEGAPSDKS